MAGQPGLFSGAKPLGLQSEVAAVLFVQYWGKKNTSGRSLREGTVTTFGFLGGLAAAPAGGMAGEGGAVVVGGTAWLLTGAGGLDEYGFYEGATLRTILCDGTSG